MKTQNQNAPVSREADLDQQTFDILKGELASLLPINLLKLDETESICAHQENRRRIVSACIASKELLMKFHGEWVRMLEAVLSTNAVKKWRFFGYFDKARNSMLHDHWQQIPRAFAVSRDIYIADSMLGDDAEILRRFQESLTDECNSLVGTFHNGLKKLRGLNFLGDITWESNHVCRYTYARTWRISKVVSVTEREELRWQRTNTRREIELRDTIQTKTTGVVEVCNMITHHLYNAARYQFPAKNVRHPYFMNRLWRAVPSWIDRQMFVSEGDMLRESQDQIQRCLQTNKSEKTIRTVQTGRLYSPALSIGTFVLTGWSGADLYYGALS